MADGFDYSSSEAAYSSEMSDMSDTSGNKSRLTAEDNSFSNDWQEEFYTGTVTPRSKMTPQFEIDICIEEDY